MGLDMYLNKKHYVKNWEHNKDEKFKVTVKLNDKKHPAINTKKVINIEEEVMYWRKANAIHNWFVENVQGGKDECQESYVDPTKLQELLDVCIEVSKASKIVEGQILNTTVARAKLPVQGGFFFGGTEYDEWYLRDIKETIKILKKELSIDYGHNTPEYYYHASW